MIMADLFTLRPATQEDMALIDAYALAEGMDAVGSPEGITVAQNADGEPVGFLRLVLGANGFWHVNPVVVYGPWRGYGVGRALTEAALAEKGELRLVARGSAVPFYEREGFAACAWDEVDLTVTEDCDGCPYRAECAPVPMVKIRT